ncbi:MAG: hypothetical protein JOZ77_12645 [Candidatus Eremiobacteraeota bacterium]|nr:hypothetical protein [Candidatus Eremiobacteraeota bacterium]
MTWEIINTAFAGGTFAVISVTAVAATVQLRHLRVSNQLIALTKVIEDWQRRDLQGWLRFARHELPERLKDDAFVSSLSSPDRTQHPEILLADYFEILGTTVKRGLTDKVLFIDAMAGPVVSAYEAVRPVLHIMRRKEGNALYENFEYLATECKLWTKRHPDGTYPKGFPRYEDVP